MTQTPAAAGWIVLSALTVSGQGTTAAPEFEVASVKPADAQDRGPLANLPGHLAEMMGFKGGPGTNDPGRIDYQGVSLKMLLARAYDVKPEEISGPGWLGSELFTVEAKVAPGTTAGQLRLMLRKLLADRFQVSLHREVKETPVYRLKAAKNGPRLKPPEADPQYKDEDEKGEAMRKSAQANLAKMLAAQKANAGAGVKTPGFRWVNCPHATMERLAEMLSGSLDRLVKT